MNIIIGHWLSAMDMSRWFNLTSAAFGVVGTIILTIHSYSFEPFEGGIFGSDALTQHNNDVRLRNVRRSIWQRRGLWLIMIGFAVQAVSAVAP